MNHGQRRRLQAAGQRKDVERLRDNKKNCSEMKPLADDTSIELPVPFMILFLQNSKLDNKTLCLAD